MSYINKQDTDGTKGALTEGELGYDKQGADRGRVYVGTDAGNVALARKDEAYVHYNSTSGNINVDTGALTGATVISDLNVEAVVNTEGHVVSTAGAVSTRDLTAANIGALSTSLGGILFGDLYLNGTTKIKSMFEGFGRTLIWISDNISKIVVGDGTMDMIITSQNLNIASDTEITGDLEVIGSIKDQYFPGDNVLSLVEFNDSITNTSEEALCYITVYKEGAVTIKYSLVVNGHYVYTKIYVNGVEKYYKATNEIFNVAEDISIASGDSIEISMWVESGLTYYPSDISLCIGNTVPPRIYQVVD